MEPKMKSTLGSMKSLKASLAGRTKKSTCKTPMVRLVTPMGTTSNTHQVAASKKTAKEPFPSGDKAKAFPLGSIAGGPGRRVIDKNEKRDPDGHEQIFFPAKPHCGNRCRVATHKYSLQFEWFFSTDIPPVNIAIG